MRLFVVQMFFVLAFDIVDLGGNKMSIGDGRVTVLVLATTNEVDRAQKVGDNTPDYCLGDPKYRMVTVIEFASHHSATMRAIINKGARNRAATAGRSLQARYDALGIKRDARSDVFVATDFEGAVAKELGVSLGDRVFEVFVLNGKGRVVEHWREVPTRDALDAALRSAAQ